MSSVPPGSTESSAPHDQTDIATPGPSLWRRLRVACHLLLALRKPDFQAAGAYVNKNYANSPPVIRWLRFVGWSLHQMFVDIPEGLAGVTAGRITRTPMWLDEPNPLLAHPWRDRPDAKLPADADTLVIGAGFTGAALAHFWSKHAPPHRRMIVLEMGEVASGSSGRNAGLVVMGRYYKFVRDTVLAHLPNVRADLPLQQQDQLARQFAAVYCKAAYHNSQLIEQTIADEGIDCNFVRAGWVHAMDEPEAMAEAASMAVESGYTDWTSLSPDQVKARTGMDTQHLCGFSQAAASWHPARWVWALFTRAVQTETVELFTTTRVTKIERDGDAYIVQTDRGPVRTRHVVNATEAYTPKLIAKFRDAVLPIQEQAAAGQGGPQHMTPHIGISGKWYFTGRYGPRTLFGSGGSRIADHEAGRNAPSGFLSGFVLGEIRRTFGRFGLHWTHEWSGTVGYTPDEYPIVGLIDGRAHYIIAGMCGSGSAVSFNAGRCIVNRILTRDEQDDYPENYFAPGRLLDPANHAWPDIESQD